MVARGSRIVETALAATFVAVGLWGVLGSGTIHGPRWVTVPAAILVGAPLLLRRTRPVLATALVTAAIMAQALASGDSAEGFHNFGWAFVAYSVGAHRDRRRAFAGLAILAVGYGVFAFEDRNIRSGQSDQLWAGAFFGLAIFAAWLIGAVVRRELERRQLEQETADRREHVAAAIAEERTRMARELHDIVSHNLSVVVLQAAGARAGGNGAAPGTLEKIERSGREALVEMRRLLGVLRDDGDSAQGTLAPQPGVHEVETLAANVRGAGLPVDVELHADRDLPPAVSLAAYRIVQEALTNTLKHARASRAVVRVDRDGDDLVVEVIDDGVGETASERPGHGLIGMYERVSLFGGELTTGPAEPYGFAVRARLPLTETS